MALAATGPGRGGGLLVAMVLAVLVGCRQEPVPPWQASLEGDGWVRVDRTLTDFTNHTWYGLESEHGDFRVWTYYLTPSGETGLLRGRMEEYMSTIAGRARTVSSAAVSQRSDQRSCATTLCGSGTRHTCLWQRQAKSNMSGVGSRVMSRASKRADPV